VTPENIHTATTEGIGNSEGGGVKGGVKDPSPGNSGGEGPLSQLKVWCQFCDGGMNIFWNYTLGNILVQTVFF